jgi:bifunctional non-homologous end joining protein LigD
VATDTGLKFVRPMECTAVDEIPDDASKWMYEVKLDGYRCCAVVKNGKAFLYSRYGNAWPERFPKITSALAAIDEPVVLDGEIVAIDRQGRPSFQELQSFQKTRLSIVYYVFDILHRGSRDLRRVPIEERKQNLEEIAKQFEEPVRIAATLDVKLSMLIPRMKKLGVEGIVAKRRGSLYESGKRSERWLKHRFNQVAEFVIGGYIAEDKTFSRLMVGEWRGDELHFVKKLKNGFSAFTKEQVMKAIRGLKVKTNPFVNLPEKAGSRHSAVDEEVMKTVTWVRPVRKVEVEFVERTSSGRLRHSHFRQLVDER